MQFQWPYPDKESYYIRDHKLRYQYSLFHHLLALGSYRSWTCGLILFHKKDCSLTNQTRRTSRRSLKEYTVLFVIYFKQSSDDVFVGSGLKKYTCNWLLYKSKAITEIVTSKCTFDTFMKEKKIYKYNYQKRLKEEEMISSYI